MIKNAEQIIELGNQSIVSVLQRYVTLEKKGRSWLGLCPFHTEKTPSFTVNPDKGFYKCFGCGQAGDSAKFLTEYVGMTFPEALEHLSGVVNMKVEYTDPGDRTNYLEASKAKQQLRDAMLAQLDAVYKMYYPRPDDSWYTTYQYCNIDTREEITQVTVDGGRTWSQSTLEDFGICWAPAESFIAPLIVSEGLDADLLQAAGIVKKGSNGLYDFFRNRLLFPIHNHLGHICGFAGRKPQADSDPKNPKYLNSPESAAYEKDKILYALHQHKAAIRDAGSAILLEGYTDVITLHDNGVRHTVATCGTAFTEAQANLLKRYTDNVIVLRDGDMAGTKAAMRDVETCLQANLRVKVCCLPEGEDPDSFMRSAGAEAFIQYLAENTQDGLEWRVMLEWDETDPFKRETSIRLAGELLSSLDSEILRDEYIRRLTTKKRMGAVAKQIKQAISLQEEKLMQQGKKKLTPQQTYDAQQYGIYEANNKYYLSNDTNEGTGVQISNFVIKPIMLIVARQESKRLVEVINEHGHTFIDDIDSKVFTDFNGFQRYIEGKGNYLYNEWCKPQHHIKIKRKLYDNMPTCYPIYTMGWHKEGFYTWANGIITPEGKFINVNEYGLVSYQDTRFFLPSYSNINISSKSDDEENSHEDQKNFCYQPAPKSISFKRWAELLVKVNGDNGMMAIAWYIAAIFRDIIYTRINYFPHLNHFGPPGSGKSYLAWSIVYMFGAKPKAPFHLVNGTDAAFFRTLSWVRNGVAWFDEYSNDVRFERVEQLKGAYDGSGREKAKDAYGHNVTRTPVNSGCIITGQQQPTKDVALFTRCISLNFSAINRSHEQIKQADDLRVIEQTGQLTQITADMVKHRALIEEKFIGEFEAIKSLFRQMLLEQDNLQNIDRIINNHVVPLAVVAILAANNVVEFPFTYGQLADIAYANIIQQADAIGNQDEVSIFWQIVDYLLAKGLIRHGEDIIVESKVKETFKDTKNRGERRDSLAEDFPEEVVLVYINFTRIHPEYQERHQRSRSKTGLDIEALKYYLRSSEPFAGEKHGKKFKGQSKPAYVFRRDELPIQLRLTAETSEVEEEATF